MRTILVVVAVVASSLFAQSPPARTAGGSGPDWDQVLGAAQGTWPRPLPEVVWRDDLRSALQEARSTGRPLFVTLRCEPCKQCADFDRDVLEGGRRLTPLLRQFITVRLTDASAIDLGILPAAGFQDLDVSWWGWFLSPRGRVYGVFGGRDEVSDTTRISEQALVTTMSRVLDHHSDPRRGAWNVDGPAPDPTAAAQPPQSLPGFDAWRKHTPPAPNESCVHCHQVVEVMRQPALAAGTFDKVHDLGIWPLPENVGIVVDRDHGLLVTDVAAGSPADKLGIRVGDTLAAAGGRKLFGQTDFRAVLHREADPEGSIEVHWIREGQRQSGPLELPLGWRRTVLHWRMSVSQGNIGAGPGFPWPAKGPPHGGRMSIRPWFGKHPERSAAWRAGLRAGHVITAVDGESPDIFGRAFLTWFRLRYEPGDEVVLTVREGVRQRDIEYRLPE